MNLDLSDEETEALLPELNDIIDRDRYLLSQRIQTLKAISTKNAIPTKPQTGRRERSEPSQ
jgi:hypothetical protein